MDWVDYLLDTELVSKLIKNLNGAVNSLQKNLSYIKIWRHFHGGVEELSKSLVEIINFASFLFVVFDSIAIIFYFSIGHKLP